MVTRSAAFVVLALSILGVSVEAQNRKLGPKDREVILDSRVDASYASTPMSTVVFLPFSNELDYSEGADVLAQTFIGAMLQKHPEIKILAPEDSRNLIKAIGLTNEYRAFNGNYANTGVYTTVFLQALGKAGKVDAVLLGHVLTYGAQRQTRAMIFGNMAITWNKDRAVAGMELALVRVTDGRELWRGAHAIEGAKNENVLDVSKVVGTVFASFFGRRPY